MIDDQRAIKFCNEILRPLADDVSHALRLLDQILIDRNPNAKDLDSLFPISTDFIQDGSPTDGRTPITSNDVRAIFKACEILQSLADDDRDPKTGEHTGQTTRALIRKFAVNG